MRTLGYDKVREHEGLPINLEGESGKIGTWKTPLLFPDFLFLGCFCFLGCQGVHKPNRA